ncbi:hypothetical protein ACHAW5_002590 [Stephanodiscus triporus]|uniref:Cilia- and flagella-associated protein 206 n=1 Tax=Stephanodiscus triporus TaxID=2934178 RepID=A0ABD3MEQ2_9STRA
MRPAATTTIARLPNSTRAAALLALTLLASTTLSFPPSGGRRRFVFADAAAAAASSSSSSSSSHVVSATDARLPMSLSTVIQDLEAEGASYVTTAAFLTSKSVRRSEGARLLRSLFGVTGDGDHDGEVNYGTTTAFGKKFDDVVVVGREGRGRETVDDDDDDDDDGGGGGGTGVAIACPPCSSRFGATASVISSTVVACGGTVVYVADAVDLGRGEGLFDYLGPALERLLAFRASTAEAAASSSSSSSSSSSGGASLLPSERRHRRPSTLVVVFRGIDGDKEDAMAVARGQWEAAASQMLASIIQPTTTTTTMTSGKRAAVELSDVFDRIEYLDASERHVEALLCPAGGAVSSPGSPGAREPAEVASSVSDVVSAGLVEDLGPVVEMSAKVPVKQKCPRLTNPVDLAAARLLGPLARSALADCMDTIKSATGGGGEAAATATTTTTTLVPEFGALADAAIRRALDSVDAAIVAQPRFKKSSVARRVRADLRENLYAEVGDVYEMQVTALRDRTFASFRARLNGLRIGPGLPNQMGEVAEACLAEFATAVRRLRVPRATSYGSWTTNADQISSLRVQFAEHNAERLRAARASGQFRPIPRKGVTVGFHWLLPKPFGNDYRQEPHLTHTADDLVYAPVDGITDVSGSDIRSGDWRRGVVPAPTGTEMMYLK